MTKLLIVGCGGFIGAVCRYAIGYAIESRSTSNFPYGTLTVNVLGCLAIGFFVTFVQKRPYFSAETGLFLQVGLLGAFTTFSTFSHETLNLITTNQWRAGLLSVLGNVVLGLGAVALGGMIGRRF